MAFAIYAPLIPSTPSHLTRASQPCTPFKPHLSSPPPCVSGTQQHCVTIRSWLQSKSTSSFEVHHTVVYNVRVPKLRFSCIKKQHVLPQICTLALFDLTPEHFCLCV
ncbi:hypothetical protein M408DRAFT_31162 [Serendipita vermifera MAFF 305830]|uniref:Uncharacterized protein n=1 Tax=Serendipita vermifera MAFF 305830 TaxID=933852 RepID=A0A0C2WPB4_SERVB|nr:hypothetical protein M408DRAFT_31162 [Serendipita vermifera MAFF 305830]